MSLCPFYFFQINETRAKYLLNATRMSLKQCSKLFQRLAAAKSSSDRKTVNSLAGQLQKAIEKGESFENELFKLCEMENVSPHQLQLLGHKITFADWRSTHDLQEYGLPLTFPFRLTTNDFPKASNLHTP